MHDMILTDWTDVVMHLSMSSPRGGGAGNPREFDCDAYPRKMSKSPPHARPPPPPPPPTMGLNIDRCIIYTAFRSFSQLHASSYLSLLPKKYFYEIFFVKITSIYSVKIIVTEKFNAKLLLERRLKENQKKLQYLWHTLAKKGYQEQFTVARVD